jgi:hypothetical protein
MKGKLDLKNKARELRKSGRSIKEIKRNLNVSLSSVSLWVRDIKLSKKQLNNLYLNRRTGNLKGSIIAAQNKIRKRELITQKLKKEGFEEIGKLKDRERFLVGVSIYAGEGGKTDRDISFVNSDPKLIKFMISWFIDFCSVSPEKLRGSLYIHDDLNEIKAKEFWSKLTKIPLNQFTKSYIAKNNKKRLRKKKHENGIFRIQVSNANLHRKIMGWVDGIFK